MQEPLVDVLARSEITTRKKFAIYPVQCFFSEKTLFFTHVIEITRVIRSVKRTHQTEKYHINVKDFSILKLRGKL